MLLFGRDRIDRPDLVLETGDILLRPPQASDYAAWARLRKDSRDFLTPWEPSWGPDELSRPTFRARLRRYAADIATDQAYPFFIIHKPDGALMGGLGLTQLRRGAAAMATLGYWMGKPYAGKGHMTEAVVCLARLAFSTLRLKRIEAACVPENRASIRLFEKVGFEREGYARQYLEINGVWRDHLLYALLADRFREQRPVDKRA